MVAEQSKWRRRDEQQAKVVATDSPPIEDAVGQVSINQVFLNLDKFKFKGNFTGDLNHAPAFTLEGILSNLWEISIKLITSTLIVIVKVMEVLQLVSIFELLIFAQFEADAIELLMTTKSTPKVL